MAHPSDPRTRGAAPETRSSEPPSDAYTPIACGVHDRLEAYATRAVPCAIEYRSEEGETLRRVARFVDIYATQGVEYLELSTGERIRLDRILSFEAED